MRLPRSTLLAFALMAAHAPPLLAQEAEAAYRLRAEIYADQQLVTAATWVGVIDRTSLVEQRFSTPYLQRVARTHQGKSLEGHLEGEVTMAVRPFLHRGRLCLHVDLNSQTVGRLHHDRRGAELEVLPGGRSYAAGGDYCDSAKTAEGLRFNLSHGDDAQYTNIFVMPEPPVRAAN